MKKKHKMRNREPKKGKKNSKKFSNRTILIAGIVTGILLLGAAAFVIIQSTYTITNVIVEGNVHYSDEEIQESVMEGIWGDNSLLLSLRYKNKEVKNIPFVETMDVTIVSPDTIKITVYEKALAGYIEYLGRYMYFDKDGMIVESSDMKTSTIPQVTGLDFGYVVLYEKLPVENEEIFKQILNVTQLLTKYGILADKIYFDSSYHMTLYFKEAKVMIGSNEYLDEKIIRLKEMIPHLEGKKGTLRMENYSENSKFVSFELE